MSGTERAEAAGLCEKIRRLLVPLGRTVRLMEVCGTHTVSIFRAGLRQLLPECVELVSGPGCPVCVTADSYIDRAVALAGRPDVIVATFGDMLRVPGSAGSLAAAAADGAAVQTVYSPLDSVQLAADNPQKTVVFLAVGFETTAPGEAAAVLAAEQAGLGNYAVLSGQKLMPPALRLLLAEKEDRPDGLLLPGHVAVITGADSFRFVARDYGVPGAVAGFEPLEILRAVSALAELVAAGRAAVVNEYPAVVRPEGNPAARRLLERVYEPVEAEWRGLGMLPASGLRLREEYAAFDIERRLQLPELRERPGSACRCGEVLRGRIKPPDCPLFGRGCTPAAAMGPCMVSVEGTCAAWFRYGRERFIYEG